MTFCLYTNSLSEHQLPLARALARRLGEGSFCYLYTGDCQKFQQGTDETWSARVAQGNGEQKRTLEEADVVLVGGLRPIELMESRLKAGRTTFYMSERWFKPILIYIGHIELRIPGWVRMFAPSYRRMAKRFAALFMNEQYRYLPIGPWAAQDMKRLLRSFYSRAEVARFVERFIPWGDFVAPSVYQSNRSSVAQPPVSSRQSVSQVTQPLKVLYIGRLLKLKHVETIIKAVRLAHKTRPMSLTIVGEGPELDYLKQQASDVSVEFRSAVPLKEVRKVMREHDVMVFASNGFDGWGATVLEALTEGVPVIGTHETGASAAILPPTNLFHCGDYKALAEKLTGEIPVVPVGEWTAESAAERLLKEVAS